MKQHGRNGDTELGHLAKGELVIPTELQSIDFFDTIKDAFTNAGVDINRYIVGDDANSINPVTGYSEYFLGTAMAALSAAGSIAGAMGKGKSASQKTESKQGFETLSPEQKKWMNEIIFPKVQSYGEGTFQGMPKRALDESDTDPIFGSKRRVAYNDVVKQQMFNQMKAPVVEEAPLDVNNPQVMNQIQNATNLNAGNGLAEEAANILRLSGNPSQADYDFVSRLNSADGLPDFTGVDTSMIHPDLQKIMARFA